MNKTIQIDNWKLTRLSDGTQITAHVPGDITNDLFVSGIIPDPYYADNFKKVGWVASEDFDYTVNLLLQMRWYRPERQKPRKHLKQL